jgi:aminoglycoside N3'-acetyltransferase
MGILTEFFRNMPNVVRTAIPIYSVAISGKYKEELSSITDKHVFGKGSIFGKLHDKNGKIMIINLSWQDSWTFAHYIEKLVGVNYRYEKIFSGKVIVGDKSVQETVTMSVRDLDKGVETNVEPIGKILEERNLVKIKKIGKSTIKLMSTKEIVPVVIEEIQKNPSLMYEIRKTKNIT